jgi:hypothetical protein
MNGYLPEYRVVLFKLQALGGILFIFGGNVAGSARHARSFMLGAFHDYLYPVSSFCHWLSSLNLTVFYKIIQNGRDAPFVNGFDGLGRHLQLYPFILLGDEELL